MHVSVPSPSLSNVSWVCLGINVFKINIDGEGKKTFASVLTIMTGM